VTTVVLQLLLLLLVYKMAGNIYKC